MDNTRNPDLTAEDIDVLLASPLSPAEASQLEADLAAIQEAASEEDAAMIRQGEALDRIRTLNLHRGERTAKGKPIPTERGRWEAYLRRRWPGIRAREADELIAIFRDDLARRHHCQAAAEDRREEETAQAEADQRWRDEIEADARGLTGEERRKFLNISPAWWDAEAGEAH